MGACPEIYTTHSATYDAQQLSSCYDGGENASLHANLGQGSKSFPEILPKS